MQIFTCVWHRVIVQSEFQRQEFPALPAAAFLYDLHGAYINHDLFSCVFASNFAEFMLNTLQVSFSIQRLISFP